MTVPMPLQTLRPLPATVRLPQARTASRVCHLMPKDVATKASLAEDNFVGRPYTTKGIPAVGRGTDGAIRSAKFMADDAKLMCKPGLRPSTRLAAAGKVAAGVDNVTFFGEVTVNGVRQAHHQPNLVPPAAVTQIHRIGAVGNLALAKVALPSLAAATVVKTSEAIRLSRQAGVSADERRLAWKNALYSQAGMLSIGAGITGSVSTLATTGSLASPLTRTAQYLTVTDTFQALDKVNHVLAPIADGTLLAADALQLHQVMTCNSASRGQKARAWFNVGLDSVKVVSHFAPNSPYAKTAYTVAGVVQLGLAGYDLYESRHGHALKRHARHRTV